MKEKSAKQATPNLPVISLVIAVISVIISASFFGYTIKKDTLQEQQNVEFKKEIRELNENLDTSKKVEWLSNSIEKKKSLQKEFFGHMDLFSSTFDDLVFIKYKFDFQRIALTIRNNRFEKYSPRYDDVQRRREMDWPVEREKQALSRLNINVEGTGRGYEIWNDSFKESFISIKRLFFEIEDRFKQINQSDVNAVLDSLETLSKELDFENEELYRKVEENNLSQNGGPTEIKFEKDTYRSYILKLMNPVVQKMEQEIKREQGELEKMKK